MIREIKCAIKRSIKWDSMPWPEEDGFFVSAFDFDAVGFDVWVVLQSIVNDAAIEGAQRFKLDDVSPTANFLGGFFGFFDEGFAGLGAIATNVEHDFG